MPTIDTTTIEGFDAMSTEDKLAAVLQIEIPEKVDLTKYIAKSTFDKKASEAAELAKKLKGKMTEDELAQAEREQEKLDAAQKYTDLETKFNELMRKNTIAEYKAQYIGQGMSAELAEETATALADGDMNKVFENQAKARAALEQRIREELINSTPKPGGNGGGKDGGGDDEASALSKKIGKARAEAYKNASETLKHYIQ